MKTYKITMNGKTYEVAVERGEAIMVDEYVAAPAPAPVAPAPAVQAPAPSAPAAPAAPAAPTVAAGEPVTSPMPGTILDVKVKAGDAVKSGQLIAILEAMKMDNDITAPCDGTVSFCVAKGANVESDTVLFVIG